MHLHFKHDNWHFHPFTSLQVVPYFSYGSLSERIMPARVKIITREKGDARGKRENKNENVFHFLSF